MARIAYMFDFARKKDAVILEKPQNLSDGGFSIDELENDMLAKKATRLNVSKA